MSEDGWAECCLEILVAIGLAFLIEWCTENPPCGIVVGTGFLGAMMVVLPIYWFIKESRQTIGGRVVVGYFLGFFIWIMAMIVGVVGGLSAILGFLAFLGIGIVGLLYRAITAKLEKRKEERKKAVVWELKDQLKDLKEQLGRGAITQQEYKQRRKKLLERSPELKDQLEKRRKVLPPELGEQLIKLKRQLRSGAITREEYERKKKKILEKSES